MTIFEKISGIPEISRKLTCLFDDRLCQQKPEDRRWYQ